MKIIQSSLWLAIILLFCATARANIIEYSGGPITTSSDTEVLFSPATGEISTTLTDNSLFGVSNAFGTLALAFNAVPDALLVVSPLASDPNLFSVAHLSAGALIGPFSSFDNTEYILAESSGRLGNWNNVGTGYFGFEYQSADGAHYGWANITVLPDFNITLNSFATETVAGASIAAGASAVPEPSSIALGAFGLFSVAIGLWRRKSKATLAAVAVAGTLTLSVPLHAQNPGDNDPIGGRLMQFRDDWFLSLLPENSSGFSTARQWAPVFGSNPFSVGLQLPLYQNPSFPAGGQFQLVAGRNLTPTRDYAVSIYANGSGQIEADVQEASSANTTFGSPLPRFARSMPAGDQSPTVDFISAASGDLDRQVDTSGNFHDEVVVAYVGSDNNVKLAVLDYSNNIADLNTGALTPIPPRVTQISVNGLNFDPTLMAGTAGPDSTNPQSKILPGDNMISVTTGDFDGDQAKEIALGFVSGTQSLTVQTYRYRGGPNPSISLLGTQTLAPVQQGGYNTDPSANEPGAMAANVSMVSGDYLGIGNDQVAVAFMQWRRDAYIQMQEFMGRWAVAPRFVVNVLSSSNQNTQNVPVSATPGFPTYLTVDSQYMSRVPHQITISGATNDWNILNGTWDTVITGDGKIQINLDSSSVAFGLNAAPLTLNLTNPLALPSSAQPLVINSRNQFNGPPYHNEWNAFSTFDYNIQYTMPRIQLVSGLFKLDPANNWTFSRRQFAAVYSQPQFCSLDDGPNSDVICTWSIQMGPYAIGTAFYSVTADDQGAAQFNQDAIIAVNPPTSGDYSWNQFSATAGAFRGATVIGSDGTAIMPPIWQVAISAAYNSKTEQIFLQELNGTSINSAFGETVALNNSDNVMRQAMVNYDPRGNSVFLGSPVKFSTTAVFTPISILEEPPKHAAWLNLGKGAAIQNFTRNDGMNVQFQSASSQQVNTTSDVTTSSTFSATNTVSAGASVDLNLFAVVKDNTSIQDTAKFTYDYNQNKDTYNSLKSSINYTTLAQTDHDDYLRAQTQDLTVWRYRVYGARGASGGDLFYDLTFPGKATDASGGGLGVDWYQPIHENGNALSYPALPPSALPDDLGPAPSIIGPVPSTLTNGLLYAGTNGQQNFCFGGTSATSAVTMAGVSSSSDKIGNGKTNSWDNDTKVGTKFKVGSFSGNLSWEGDFGQKQSWSSTTSTANTTSGSQTITFNLGSGDGTWGYFIYPYLYNSLASVLKFTHYVNIPTTASQNQFCGQGAQNWTDFYGYAPDPALNLPNRFSWLSYNKSVDTTTWTLNTGIERERIRGFFIEDPNANSLEGNDVFTPISSTVVEGTTVRLGVRVYNYSVGAGNNAQNVQVNFSAAPYDSNTDNETGCGPVPSGPGGRICPPSSRISLGSVTLGSIPSWTNGQNWVEAGFTWAVPSDFIESHNATDYRIYVNLQLPNPQIDINPPQHPCIAQADGSCQKQIAIGASDPNWDPLAPGQNNEGWGLITLSFPPAPLLGAAPGSPTPIVRPNVKTVSDSLAGFDPSGNLKTGIMTVYLNSDVRLRVKAVAGGAAINEAQKVLVFDGSGANRTMIAGKVLRDVKTTGSQAWLDWRPTTLGLHQLSAQFLQPIDDPDKNDDTAKLSVLVIRNPADVNGDGQVDSRDIDLIDAERGNSPKASKCGTACDVNGDGLIGRADEDAVTMRCDHPYCQVNASVSKRSQKP